MNAKVKPMNAEKQLSAGAAIFGKLKAIGVDYVFTNSGTDFPPIIEGLIDAQKKGVELPTAITVPHESVALGMAHGYYQISGRAQAVMLHTNVGLANGAIGAINASCDHVPMIIMSGRTPVTESQRFGARTVPIGWGQEMYDQTSLVREAVKWDYELRFPEQVSELLDRAWAISNSTPKGPVYLSLPREVLCEATSEEGLNSPSSMAPVVTSPDPTTLSQAAELLAKAKNPLIISQRGVGSQQMFDELAAFLDDWAIPLSHYWANQVSIPLSHPMQIGSNPDALLAEADVVLVINSLAPWWPDKVQLKADAKVIHLGPDPLFTRTPIRNFKADLTLSGETDRALKLLMETIQLQAGNRDDALIKARRNKIISLSALNRESVVRQANKGQKEVMSKEWVSLCLGRAINNLNGKASVFHELGCPLEPLNTSQHQGYFQEPHSGGLGWGLPAALGAQLADRERVVFATMGDGSYMFANPTVCHQIAEAMELPIITLVLNNEEWGAVRHSVEGLYKQGLATQVDKVPLTALQPSPDFCKTAEASRAYTETVSNGEDLPAALDRAIKVATENKRQVLLNIAVEKS